MRGERLKLKNGMPIAARSLCNVALAIALVVFLNTPVNSASQPARKPNIVLILADDLGYGDVRSNFPDGKIETPNIDALAKRGMRFSDAHSGAAVCSPSRYGIMTGQNFSRQDWGLIGHQLWASMIDDDRLTLPKLLQANGYHTGAFGKWHLGQTFYKKDGREAGPEMETDWTRPMTGGPNDRGFDEYFGILFSHALFLMSFVSNRLTTEVPTDFAAGWPKVQSFRPIDAMPTVAEQALNYIDWNVLERPGQPFFLYFPTISIHEPLIPAPEFIGKSGVGIYGDSVMQLDATVGAVVSRLEAHGLLENTLIIVTSDNGSGGRADNRSFDVTEFGSVTRLYGHKMNGNWRGIKGTLWEGGHRVPFIASWPGHIKFGTVSNELIVLDDLMATIAAIVGVELPDGSAEDSYNILPYLEGTHKGPPIRKYAVISTFNGDPVLRKGKWVLGFTLGTGGQFTTAPEPQPGGPKGQLYDLESDPGQVNNVWLQQPGVVADLTAFYNGHVERGASYGIDR